MPPIQIRNTYWAFFISLLSLLALCQILTEAINAFDPLVVSGNHLPELTSPKRTVRS